jgi:hypothetical protein
MALLDTSRIPSRKELSLFGLMALAFFGLLGAWMGFTSGSWGAPKVLWAFAALFTGTYYAVPALQLPLFRLWLWVVFPIGWVVSHLALGVAYYLVLTPIGFFMRLRGRDSMNRRIDRAATTYWTEHRTGGDPASYFRQF